MILWCNRTWLHCKIGKGSPEHAELTKDLMVFIINRMWADEGILQHLMLWLRWAL